MSLQDLECAATMLGYSAPEIYSTPEGLVAVVNDSDGNEITHTADTIEAAVGGLTAKLHRFLDSVEG